MKSGSCRRTTARRADDVIAGSDRDPTRLAELPDEDPDDVGEAQAVTADAS